MKKITSVLLALACFACGETKDKQAQAPPAATATTQSNLPPSKYANTALQQYDRYLASIDTQLVDAGRKAVDTFKALFNKQPAAACDTALYLYNELHSRLANYQYNNMEHDGINYLDFISYEAVDRPTPLSKKHKARKKALDDNGFFMGAEEGGVYITQDRKFIAHHFGPYVSTPMKQYLDQLGKEQLEGFSDDAAIVIRPEVLAERTVWWEKFKKANPNFIYVTEAAYNFRIDLYALIIGMDNTPVFEFLPDTNITDSLSTYFSAAWKHVQDKHPQTETGQVIKPFAAAFQNRDSTAIRLATEEFEKKYVFTNP